MKALIRFHIRVVEITPIRAQQLSMWRGISHNFLIKTLWADSHDEIWVKEWLRRLVKKSLTYVNKYYG